jgi:hypothetical protein
MCRKYVLIFDSRFADHLGCSVRRFLSLVPGFLTAIYRFGTVERAANQHKGRPDKPNSSDRGLASVTNACLLLSHALMPRRSVVADKMWERDSTPYQITRYQIPGGAF